MSVSYATVPWFYFEDEGFFMFSKQLVAVVLLACFAGMSPVSAAGTEKAAAADTKAAADTQIVVDTQAAVSTPVSKTDAHSAVNQTGLLQAPAFTTVITAEEIEDNHYETVAEALTYAPGITVTPGSVNTAHQVVRIDGDDRRRQCPGCLFYRHMVMYHRIRQACQYQYNDRQ